MLFSEIYGSYFSAVSTIITEALEGSISDRRMNEIISRKCFGESTLSIPTALRDGSWPLLGAISNAPHMPATTLEKRWLKSILADRRIKLFGVSAEGLEDVEPLFTPDMFEEYDRYADGDPYDSPEYIAHFRALTSALREKKPVRIAFTSSRGNALEWDCLPLYMEYSAKDDKFRVVVAGSPFTSTINVSRITGIISSEGTPAAATEDSGSHEQQLVFELTDVRNALERVMMHFSHLRKETERIGGDTYRVTMYYDRDDETEILIRILSFGPAIKVISPDSFREKLVERLKKQLDILKS